MLRVFVATRYGTQTNTPLQASLGGMVVGRLESEERVVIIIVGMNS